MILTEFDFFSPILSLNQVQIVCIIRLSALIVVMVVEQTTVMDYCCTTKSITIGLSDDYSFFLWCLNLGQFVNKSGRDRKKWIICLRMLLLLFSDLVHQLLE